MTSQDEIDNVEAHNDPCNFSSQSNIYMRVYLVKSEQGLAENTTVSMRMDDKAHCYVQYVLCVEYCTP